MNKLSHSQQPNWAGRRWLRFEQRLHPAPTKPGRFCLVPALIAIGLSLVLGGCAAQRYQMTLSSGEVIQTKGKPKLDQHESVYRYKDLTGRKGVVPLFRVRAIEPKARP